MATQRVVCITWKSEATSCRNSLWSFNGTHRREKGIKAARAGASGRKETQTAIDKEEEKRLRNERAQQSGEDQSPRPKWDSEAQRLRKAIEELVRDERRWCHPMQRMVAFGRRHGLFHTIMDVCEADVTEEDDRKQVGNGRDIPRVGDDEELEK